MSVFDTDDPALPQLHYPKHMEVSDHMFFAHARPRRMDLGMICLWKMTKYINDVKIYPQKRADRHIFSFQPARPFQNINKIW